MKRIREYVSLTLVWACEPFYMALDSVVALANWIYDPREDE